MRGAIRPERPYLGDEAIMTHGKLDRAHEGHPSWDDRVDAGGRLSLRTLQSS